ncbi:hypothetical protein BGX26_008699, partial [Mortierella sp. AD094]
KTLRNAEAHLSVCMGQAAVQISLALAKEKLIMESPAVDWKVAPDLNLPVIQSWFDQARKWSDIIRASKQMLSMFAPTIYRYESLDKKRKSEIPLSMDLPDDETRKYIFRQVVHEEDYGWSKRARVDEGLSAAVSKLSMSVVDAKELPEGESSKTSSVELSDA